MTRRQFLAMPAALAGKRPNIVFILLDDLGVGDVGCYGQTKIQTPHIDRLAREGTRFTAAYAGGPVCAPSRCVLMTGKHGGHAKIRANAGTAPIDSGDMTFVRWLRNQGYVCGGFGKWGLGDYGTAGTPWRHGFNEFFGYLHQVHAHSYYREFLWDNDKRFRLPANADGAKGTYTADVIAERSYAFLRKHKDHPFFLYATYTVPHAYFEPPDVKPYEDRDWPDGEKRYAAMVTRGDAYAGRLLEMLREFKLEDNTLVIFASDNGGVGSKEHSLEFFGTMKQMDGSVLRGQKGTLYEGGLRVPFLLRWPGRVKAGAVSNEPVYFADIFATVMHAVGSGNTFFEDGMSILRLLEGSFRRPLVWESHGWTQKTQELRPDYGIAVRIGDWKGVRNKPDGAVEIYNLKDDPGETRDLAATARREKVMIEKAMADQHTPPAKHLGSMEWVK